MLSVLPAESRFVILFVRFGIVGVMMLIIPVSYTCFRRPVCFLRCLGVLNTGAEGIGLAGRLKMDYGWFWAYCGKSSLMCSQRILLPVQI